MSNCINATKSTVAFYSQNKDLDNADFKNLSSNDKFYKYSYLVDAVIKKEFNKFIINNMCNLEDLRQEGNLTLINACKNYKCTYTESQFKSYAWLCIKNSLYEGLSREIDVVSYSGEGHRDIRKLRPKFNDLKKAYEEKGSNPEAWENFLTKTGVTEEIAQDFYLSKINTSHLDQAINSDKEVELTIGANLHDDSDLEENYFNYELSEKAHVIYEAILNTLTEKDRELLFEIILNDDPISQADFAKKKGVSRSAINQRLDNVLKKLRNSPDILKLLEIINNKTSPALNRYALA